VNLAHINSRWMFVLLFDLTLWIHFCRYTMWECDKSNRRFRTIFSGDSDRCDTGCDYNFSNSSNSWKSKSE
uniref:G-protein coupled receptors family 1 profile domain-containing protein n=1 Tax=Parascaris univalens TaxID=6257 RepID=A0A915AYH9_PARUN